MAKGDVMDEDFEYCGECPVCDSPVDHSDAGFCDSCGRAFHWGKCGTWINGKHCCFECGSEDDEDQP